MNKCALILLLSCNWCYWNHAPAQELGTNMYEWFQVGSDMNGEGTDDMFGWAVSMSPDGSRVVVGGKENDAGGSSRGHVRVFSYSGGWTQVGSDIDGSGNSDDFGYAVSLDSDGSHIAIGAPRDDVSGNRNRGSVKVYWDDSGTWTQLGGLISGESSNDYLHLQSN